MIEAKENTYLTCLFCRGMGPFSTVEHIIPESLGNDSDVLRNVVCDRCQNYFGRAVEKPALESTPFGFWRTALGTQTKAGALPRFSSRPPKSGSFGSEHPLTDHFELVAEEDASISLNVVKASGQPHKAHSEPQLRIVLSPWHIFIMGRLLGKIGMEYLALSRPDEAMSSSLDRMRDYARRGSVGWVWPIYIGRSGDLRDIRTVVALGDKESEIETECYRYSLGEHVNGGYIFALGIGLELYVMDLSDPTPGRLTDDLIEGSVLQCVYYSKSKLKVQSPSKPR